MALAIIDGNNGLYDGNSYLYDAHYYYDIGHMTQYSKIPSSEYLQYNTGGTHEGIPRYFDGNVELITNADGRQPQRPFKGLTQDGILFQILETLKGWPKDNSNIFVYKNKYGEVELVQAYAVGGTQTVVSHMLCFNDNKYRNHDTYNLRYATKFLNANIPNRNAVPLTTTTKTPWDSTLQTPDRTECYMLRGSHKLWKINNKYYDAVGNQLAAMALASPRVNELIYATDTGKPFEGVVPQHLIYEAGAAYDSYGTNLDIPFTYSFDEIVLSRQEKSLKGPLNIRGLYYWCTLEFATNPTGVTGLYKINSYLETDISRLPSRDMMVGIEHNKDVVITSTS